MDPFDDWFYQREPKPESKQTKSMTCVICSWAWEGLAVDGYYECPECKHLHAVEDRWTPPDAEDWRG